MLRSLLLTQPYSPLPSRSASTMRTSGFVPSGHGDAGQRAAGAAGAGEGVDLAVGLLPDLRPGGHAVALPVGQIVELIGPDGIAGLPIPRPCGARRARNCRDRDTAWPGPAAGRRRSCAGSRSFPVLWVSGITMTQR